MPVMSHASSSQGVPVAAESENENLFRRGLSGVLMRGDRLNQFIASPGVLPAGRIRRWH